MRIFMMPIYSRRDLVGEHLASQGTKSDDDRLLWTFYGLFMDFYGLLSEFWKFPIFDQKTMQCLFKVIGNTADEKSSNVVIIKT